MKKEICIWGNCQGTLIKYALNKYYFDLFNIIHLSNYETINNNIPLKDKIKNCDIFIYQRYKKKENSEYDIEYILDNYLKKDTIKICFPTLHSILLLFCYEIDEPRNSKTISHNFPHGKFHCGINIITDLLKKYNYIEHDIIINEIFNESQKLNFISDEKIKYYNKRSFDFLEDKILSSDIPELFDFIIKNFRKVRLWSNPNHPTGFLSIELVKCIFNKLNLLYKEENSDKDITELNNIMNDWVMPIFPSVKKYYNLEFEDECSSWYHKDITDTKSYIYKYLSELYLKNE